jgi:nucleotidyltransferase/DNA polymerase involved in DNA repair
MIIHLDADAFFASVEQAADSRLRGRAVAVGGMKRGIIASASYEARKMGVYTPMPTSQALRVCPKLIVLPGDFEKYELFSRLMFTYAYDFTPEVEVTSIDEGYCDLKGNRRVRADEAAEQMQRAVRASLKIDISEGVASNKLVSQIASKLHKPRGFAVVEPGYERDFLAPLEVKWLPGVGGKMETTLHGAGLRYIHQLRDMPTELLQMLLGPRVAAAMAQYSCGIDHRPVIVEREAAKSYSHQETFDQDSCDRAFLEATLRSSVDRLVQKLQGDRCSARTVSVKLRYADMDEVERSNSLEEPSDLAEDFYPMVCGLLDKAWDRRVRLRLLRVKLSSLYKGQAMPDLFNKERDTRLRTLQSTIAQVKKRFGPQALMRSHDWLLQTQPTPSTPPHHQNRHEHSPRASAYHDSRLRDASRRVP